MGQTGKDPQVSMISSVSHLKDRDVDLEGTYVIWLKKNESLCTGTDFEYLYVYIYNIDICYVISVSYINNHQIHLSTIRIS